MRGSPQGERSLLPRRARRAARRPQRGGTLARLALILGGSVLSIALLALFVAGLTYLRLLYSPVSASFLIRPIQAALEADLGSLSVSIKQAELRLAETGRVELGLKDIRLTDVDGLTVAIAPSAAVELSPRALRGFRLAPSRIDLIEPRLILFYAPGAGLSLSFSRGVPGGEVEGTSAEKPKTGGGDAGTALDATSQDAGHRLEVIRALAAAAQHTRVRGGSTNYLEALGLRRATVILDIEGRQSTWQVLSGEINLDHRSRRSLISGSARIAAASRPWTLAFSTEATDRPRTLQVSASVADLIPGNLANLWPGLTDLQTPISAAAKFDVATTGELLDAAVVVDLGQESREGGAAGPLALEAGKLSFGYSSASRRLTLEPSTLKWAGASQATLVGEAVEDRTRPGAWRFQIATQSASIVASDIGLAAPIERGAARGTIEPGRGALTLEEAHLTIAGAEFKAKGRIGLGSVDGATDLEGRIGVTSLEMLKALWPTGLAPRTRNWIGQNVRRGLVQSATWRMVEQARTAAPRTAPAQRQLWLTAEVADVELIAVPGLPPLELPKALIRVEADELEIAAPDARLVTSPGRHLALKGGRFQAQGLLTDTPQAEVNFKATGGAQALLDLLEREAVGSRRGAGLEGLEGRLEALARLRFPLRDGLTGADFQYEIKGRLADGRVKGMLGTHDVTGAQIGFDLNERQSDVKGELALAGVPARLAWHYVPGTPPAQQRPLVIEAILDNQERARLGLDLNHIVQGPIRTELQISRGAKDEPQVKVVASLDQADVVIEGLAWRKPPGRPARLTFDVAKGRTHRLELQNFRLVGDDIAIEGWIGLGPDLKAREFHFPDFSIHVVGQLEVQGRLRPDRVWDIKAVGKRYDGRNLFRALFSLGKAGGKGASQPERPGLDLQCEIETVLGFEEGSLKRVRLKLSRRGEKLVALDASGVLDSGQPLLAQLRLDQSHRRLLLAESPDAGRTFKLVGFYPNMVGGHMNLEIDLEGRGAAERTGILWVQNFRVIGEAIVNDSVPMNDEGRPSADATRRKGPRTVRQQIEFERMRVPFSLGHGQLVMDNAYLKGPLIGVSLRGKMDFKSQRVQLAGTYAPLSAINSAFAAVPGLGELLTGPRGEGILGITFAVEGAMANPQVILNPLSIVAPGFTREMFQMGPENQQITPRADRAAPAGKSGTEAPVQSRPKSAAPPVVGPAPAPEVLGGWSTESQQQGGTSRPPRK